MNIVCKRKFFLVVLVFLGYIRVGSRVWGKALNGDFYKGVVTGLGEMLHIKFDNGDTIAHDRSDPECVVFDQTPDVNDLEVGKRISKTSHTSSFL